jgi:hypothetical protein
MLYLHPSIEQAVTPVCPDETKTDRLKSLLAWFSSGMQTVEAESKRLQTLLDETTQADPLTQYSMLNSVELDQMVHFTLLNEFGPSFAQRRCFPYLVNQVLQTIREQRQA